MGYCALAFVETERTQREADRTSSSWAHMQVLYVGGGAGTSRLRRSVCHALYQGATSALAWYMHR